DAEPEPETPPASWVEAAPPPPAYAPISHEILQDHCGSCHAESAFAGSTALGLSGDPSRDYPVARALVDLDDPAASSLLAEARGENHGGGVALAPSSAEYAQLLAWIEGGAWGPTADDVPASATA